MAFINGQEILFGAQVNITKEQTEGVTVSLPQLYSAINNVKKEFAGETRPVPFDLQFDTFDEIEVGMSMIRFVEPIDVTKHKTTVKISERLANFMYRYINTISGGVIVRDSGWIWMDTTTDIVFEGGGQVMFQFRHGDGTQCTETDLHYIEMAVSITVEGGFSYLYDEIKAVNADVDKLSGIVENFATVFPVPFELEIGTINESTGVPEYASDVIRFTTPIPVHERTIVSMLYNEDYEFGYARYDSNGNYDGVRHGWNTMDGDEIFDGGGYVIFKFRRTDKGDIIPELDIPRLSDGVIEITTEGGLGYLDHKIEDVDAKVGDISTALDAILAKQNAVIGGAE